ncbi:VapC toxin family PIN domain ribonuclease [Pasteurellaceae bacterium 15-036681]|nr:VapC toxin family PIN domain ribonuclease [Pasteurellaceae bacterium 15-036681]
MYLLDTNVISEFRKIDSGRINPNVLRWLETVYPEDLFMSVMSLMEIKIGVLQLEHRKDFSQAERVKYWLETEVEPKFRGRILTITNKVALTCAEFHVPNKRPTNDVLIAATAMAHNYTLVTRNTKDFQELKVKLFNPFLDENK